MLCAMQQHRQVSARNPSCRPCGACRKPSARFPVAYRYGVHILFSLVSDCLFPFPVAACQYPEMDAEYAPAEADRELYSIRCHSVKWLPENDHLKYPDSEPNCGLVFLFYPGTCSHPRCAFCRQRMFRISNERHLRVGVNRHYRSFEADFHPVCFNRNCHRIPRSGNARVESNLLDMPG